MRDFLNGLLGPFPDLAFEVVEKTVQDDRAAYRWHATGTFTGTPFQGVEPTGARLDIEGTDVLIVRDGEIVENNAFADGMTVARQLGLMPPEGSRQELAMKRAFNTKTKVGARLGSSDLEDVAEGVWLLRGGFPGKTMNIYFVRDGDGVLLFDAGISQMTNAARAAGARLGGITRVLLGHGHADHRGVAPALGVPVIVVRDTTERPEGVAAGVAKLVGTETERIVAEVSHLLNNPNEYRRMASLGCPYGDGKASARICDALEYFFGMRDVRPADFDWQPGQPPAETSE